MELRGTQFKIDVQAKKYQQQFEKEKRVQNDGHPFLNNQTNNQIRCECQKSQG
jgi:hypothetical protein